MIGDPYNDFGCLDLITDHAIAAVQSTAVRDLANRFGSTGALATWIRSLPQKNDDGRGGDGPKVACDVPQRLRLPADDPNCVERSALYLAAGERLDSEPIRSLATIVTPLGRHTFPVEDDRPVNLDPRLPRNALAAGLSQILSGEDDEVPSDAHEAFDWVLALAEEPATALLGGLGRLRNAERALAAIELGERLPRNAAEDIGFALALADEESELFGSLERNSVLLSDRALRRVLARTPRNRFGFKLGGSEIRPNWDVLGALGRIGGKTAVKVGAAYVKSQLGWLGMAPEVIVAIEKELKTEGMTLGALAEPAPKPGTLEALTTSALLKRRLQNG